MTIELNEEQRVTADHIWQAACRALGLSYPIQNGPILYPPMPDNKVDTLWYIAHYINGQITRGMETLIQKFDNLSISSLGPFHVKAYPGQTYTDCDLMYIIAEYQCPGGYLTAKTQCSAHIFQPEPVE